MMASDRARARQETAWNAPPLAGRPAHGPAVRSRRQHCRRGAWGVVFGVVGVEREEEQAFGRGGAVRSRNGGLHGQRREGERVKREREGWERSQLKGGAAGAPTARTTTMPETRARAHTLTPFFFNTPRTTPSPR